MRLVNSKGFGTNFKNKMHARRNKRNGKDMIVNNLKKDQKLVNQNRYLKQRNQRRENTTVKVMNYRLWKWKRIALCRVTLDLLK